MREIAEKLLRMGVVYAKEVGEMPRRGENIYHRRDGRWEGRYLKSRESDGKARYGYVFAPTYTAVRKKLQEAKIAWETDRKPTKREGATLASVSARWLEEVKVFVKESTIAKYRDSLRCYILPKLGGIPMADLSTDNLRAFLSVLLVSGGAKEQGLSARTVSWILCILKLIRKYAVERGYAVGFSTEALSVRQEQKQPRIFSEQETKRLRLYLRGHLTECNAGILLCLETGLRLGEICALRWDDISLTERKLHVRQTAQRIRTADEKAGRRTKVVITSPKSASSARVIPLTDHLCIVLSRLRPNKGFLLTGDEERLMEPRSMQRHFKRVLENCGIAGANFHALRHTFATRGVEVGVDVKCLSSILGHSNVAMTLNRYVHPTMEMKRRSMAKLL